MQAEKPDFDHYERMATDIRLNETLKELGIPFSTNRVSVECIKKVQKTDRRSILPSPVTNRQLNYLQRRLGFFSRPQYKTVVYDKTLVPSFHTTEYREDKYLDSVPAVPEATPSKLAFPTKEEAHKRMVRAVTCTTSQITEEATQQPL